MSIRAWWLGLGVALMAGCPQGIGERCQLNSDCGKDETGAELVCIIPAGGTLQEGGTCQKADAGTGTDDAAVTDDLLGGGDDLPGAEEADLAMTPAEDLAEPPAEDLETDDGGVTDDGAETD